MNTLHDLRNVLDQHAHDLDGASVPDRLTQVRGRVRGVQRRRRAAVGAAAVAVLAVGGGVLTTLPGGERAPEPAARIAGVQVPETMTALGYTYTLTETVQGEGRTQLRLDASDLPRLVGWVSETGSLELSVDESTRDRGADDFDDYVYVAPGTRDTSVVARGEDTVGLAAYTLSAPAEGLTKDGVTFRQRRGSHELVAAAIGDRGQTELTFEFAMPERLSMTEFCTGVPDGLNAYAEIEGRLVTISECDDHLTYDGSGSFSSQNGGLEGANGEVLEPGRQVTLRMWLTTDSGADAPDRAPVAASDARLGFAIYATDEPARTIAGHQVAEETEHDGHLYRLVATGLGDPGQAVLQERIDTSRQALVWGYSAGNRTDGTCVVVAGDETSDLVSAGGGVGVPVADPGQHQVRVSCTQAGPQVRVGYAVYEQAD